MSKKIDNQAKLTEEQVSELCYLYERKGWRIHWLSKKYKINPSSVHFYKRKFNLVRLAPVPEKAPKEIAHLYKVKAKTYQNYLDEETERRRENCEHKVWTVRCSCGRILASESSPAEVLESLGIYRIED